MGIVCSKSRPKLPFCIVFTFCLGFFESSSTDKEEQMQVIKALEIFRTSFQLHFAFVMEICERESRSVTSGSLRSHGLYSPWNSPGQNTVGSLSLLQGIFLTQGFGIINQVPLNFEMDSESFGVKTSQ